MPLTVADRLELTDVVHRYAAGVDDRRFDDVIELFTDTAELILPDPPRALDPVKSQYGYDGVRTAMATLSGVARTQHEIVGEVYTDATDHVRGRIACVAHHWTRGADADVTDLVWHLRYDDQYVRADGGWRIRRRALTLNAIETRPVRRLRD